MNTADAKPWANPFRPHRTTRIALLLVATSIAGTRISAQDPCTEVFRDGIFDTRDSASSDEQASSYANWFCSHTFSSVSDAESFGGSLGFPFKGLPAKLGFNASKQSWSEWSASVCQDVRSSFMRRQAFQEHVRQASSRILDAFQACLQRKGAEVWIEHTADPAIFGYAAKFDTPTPQVSSITVQLITPETVTCVPDARSVVIPSPTTFRSTCTRKGDQLIKMVANSPNWGVDGAGELVLAAIPRSEPNLPKSTELKIDAEPVNIDFRTKNPGQTGGCHCGNGDIIFPGDLRGKVGESLTFRYDGSEVCHGQGFRNFEGAISWTGILSTPMVNRNDNSTFPGIAGTFKVTFSQAGAYNVRATFSLDCLDINCSRRCSAQGNTTLVIH